MHVVKIKNRTGVKLNQARPTLTEIKKWAHVAWGTSKHLLASQQPAVHILNNTRVTSGELNYKCTKTSLPCIKPSQHTRSQWMNSILNLTDTQVWTGPLWSYLYYSHSPLRTRPSSLRFSPELSTQNSISLGVMVVGKSSTTESFSLFLSIEPPDLDSNPRKSICSEK